MENVKNEEMVIVNDEVEFDTDDFEEEEYERTGIFKKLVIGAVGTATTVAGVVVVKNRERIKEWKKDRTIRKLEEEGYVVSAPEFNETETDSENPESEE